MRRYESKRRASRRLGKLAFLCAAVIWLWCGCAEKGAPDRQQADEEARRIGAQSSSSNKPKRDPDQPKRIILLIGDGMGAAAISGAAFASEEPLAMSSMESMNFITTHSHEYVTTDSAASATAFATGHKTHYQGISVKPGTTAQQEDSEKFHLETALEVAEKKGWKSGLVATARIVHATPAAFAAHRANRNSDEKIAADIAASGVDVLLGGGRKYFTDRSDGVDLLQKLSKDGYRMAHEPENFESATGVAERLIGLFYHDDPPGLTASQQRRVSLSAMTKGALRVLDRKNDEGFFLMVEGSQIDWREHELAAQGTIRETLEFDRAVGVALDYARGRDDTLVIVVADHETGGLSILDESTVEPYLAAIGGRSRAQKMTDYRGEGKDDASAAAPVEAVGLSEAEDQGMIPSFGHLSLASRAHAEGPGGFWSIHTPEMIPMFTEGPGAEYVADSGDNAEVGRKLRELINGERSRALARDEAKPPSSQEEPPRNVLLFVGDGVGLDALTTAFYVNGPLSMRSMPVRGLATVRGRSSLVPDDASAATTLATANRSANGVLGVAREHGGKSRPVRSVLERAEMKGYRTGIVSTGRLTNPTVAAMYAHGRKKEARSEILEDYLGMPARVDGADGIDLAFGGGRAGFDQNKRSELEGRGVDIATKWDEKLTSGRQVVRLLADGALPPVREREGDGSAAELPTLQEMTTTAIDHFADGRKPFFLVVEADGPGRLQRQLNRQRQLVDEVVEFDRAVRAGLQFARRDGETLVIATADADQTLSSFDNHYGFSDGVCGVAKRCGGSYELEELPVAVDQVPDGDGLSDSALQGEYSPPRLFLQYDWLVQTAGKRDGREGTNSANAVPVFAYGPWSGRLVGRIDQAEIAAVIDDWAKSGR